MTACRSKQKIDLDDLQIADWLAATRFAIIQLENSDAWLVRSPCDEEAMITWLTHWKVIRGGFLKLRWSEFEQEIANLRLCLPTLKDSIEIAKESDSAARKMKRMKFASAGEKNKTEGQLHLVAFSKVALCLVPEKAVVNDSWVRTYFGLENDSNVKVAEEFEKEFLSRAQKINAVVAQYREIGSSVPDTVDRLHDWTDLTLKRRILDVAIMMAAGRGI